MFCVDLTWNDPKVKKFPTQAIIPAHGNRILDIIDVQTLLHDAASCASWKKGKLDIIEEPAARFCLFPPLAFPLSNCHKTIHLRRPKVGSSKKRFLEVNY